MRGPLFLCLALQSEFYLNIIGFAISTFFLRFLQIIFGFLKL